MMRHRNKLLVFCILISTLMCAQELKLYDLTLYQRPTKDTVGFISLSDNYPLSEYPDSLAVPDVEDLERDESEYIKLEQEYRKRFLAKTQLSEKDIIFLYNYSINAFVSVPVKEVNVVATLSPYVIDDDWPYDQYDYMIGFEIDKKFLKEFNENYWHTIIYVGRKNPFVRNKLYPIVWKEIDFKNYPSAVFSSTTYSYLRDLGYSEFNGGTAYTYETKDYQYFLQDILNATNEVFARRLLVIDKQVKTNLCERLYYNSEGSSLAPLNFTDENNQYPDQWTGQLIKNMPDVVFGFEYQSFGCPIITFIGKEEDLIINCDSRH